MKLSDLLDELNISLSSLKPFEKIFNWEFISEDQTLSDKDIQRIRRLFSIKKTETKFKKNTRPRIVGNISNIGKDELENPKISQANKFKYVFKNKTNYKLIGKLKWFYNKNIDVEEGYISWGELPDIYFRSHSVKGISPYDIKQDDDLVVEIPISVTGQSKKLRANTIYRLEDESDLEFLLFECLIKNNHKIYPQALNQVSQQKDHISTTDYSNYILAFLSGDLTHIHQGVFLYNFCENGNIDILTKISEKVKNEFNLDEQFQFWKETSVSFSLDLIKSPLVNYILKTNDYSIIDKLSKTEKEIVLNKILDYHIENNASNNKLSEVLNQFDIQDVEVDFTKFTNVQIIYFWTNKLLSFSPIDVIFKRIEELYEEPKEDENFSADIISIFKTATNQELRDLFSKIHFEKNVVKSKRDFQLSRLFIDLVNDEELSQSFFETIYSKSDDYLKLQWFILDYTDELSYDDAIIYTGLLDSKSQKVFFKKVLMLIATNRLKLTLDDLKQITTIDYKTSEQAKDVDGVGLDFTLSIILKIISDLSNNEITKRKTLFDIIANQIKRPDDLLIIEGFFEKCTGRTIIKEKPNSNITDNTNTEKEKITYKLEQTDRTPRFSNFCDGTKAINTQSGSPSLCRKSGFEFWWCENSQCYNPCRKTHKPKEWRQYNLEDVLKILNVPYHEVQYEKVLNIINRVNRFLERLTCRNCNTILKPNGKSNYGFYGVTWFSCTNEKCSNPDKNVYLSHCLNGKCQDLIDSRDTVKCKPNSVESKEDCGWYICQNCFGCCSTEKIKGRKYILERTGQEYTCHNEGHKDLGIICCPKCGTETKSIKKNKKLYNKQLQWFINQCDSPAIQAYGQRNNDGKWWFRWNRGDLDQETFLRSLRGLKRNGFNVPDINSGNHVQFISEPFQEFNEEPTQFKCLSCKFEIDLSNNDDEGYDFNRIKAIKKYHNIIFSHIK